VLTRNLACLVLVGALALSNTERLIKLIDHLLELSRFESGKVELHTTAVDILALITEVVSLLQPQFEAKDQGHW
jgi:signal transduction histidine kinase